MKGFLVGIAAFIVFQSNAFAGVNVSAVQGASKEYRAVGNSIMANLKAGKLSLAEAEAAADKMAGFAHTVMKEYSVKYPESKKMIDFLIGKTAELKKLKFQQLEKDYHDAAILTKDKVGIDLKDEANERFLDPCHILIHPIMVLAAVRENNHKEGVAELNEGMEQMSTSEKELLK